NSPNIEFSGTNTITNPKINTSDMTIPSGTTLIHGYSVTQGVNITAIDLTIEPGASITGAGRGYARGLCGGQGNDGDDGSGTGGGDGANPWTAEGGGGGGYGGAGGKSGTDGAGDTQTNGGSSYGSSTQPLALGSGGGGANNGGGSSCGGHGGYGGGFIFVNASNELNVSGTISVGGYGGSSNEGGGGGGSGGSVYLVSDTLSGNGTITVNGGDGGAAHGGDAAGGGGSGGRIAYIVNTNNFTGSFSYSGGSGGGGSDGKAAEDGQYGTIYPWSGPNTTEFSEIYGTTDFQHASNLKYLRSMVLANGNGKIEYSEETIVNAEGEDYDTHVEIGVGFVSVNSSGLDGTFNISTNVSLNNIDCNADLYYGTGTYTSSNEIVALGNVCNASTDPACTNIVCSGNNLSFTASHFTGYATNALSNLTIWDEVDSGELFGDQTKYQDEQVKFFANYTNSSGALVGGNCSVWFSDTGWNNMSWNSSHSIYEYNRSFSSNGTYDWNVSCNYTGYETLNTNDTVLIFSPIYPGIDFEDPTPDNVTNTTNTSIQINISIQNASDLEEFKWNWNGTNYTFYDDDLILMANFDNISALGENSSYVVDASQHSNNLNRTIEAGADITFSQGKYGLAANFSAPNWDHGPMFHTIDEIEYGDQFTISLWFYMYLTPSGERMVVTDHNVWNANSGYAITFASSPTPSFKVGGSGGYTYLSSNKGAASNFTWYHLVATYNNSDMRLYIDGSFAGNATQDYDDSNLKTTIGSYPPGAAASGAYGFHGLIDEFRIFNRTLSEDEVEQLYYSNFQKFDTDKWNFYINESNISRGSYTYYGAAEDTDGYLNQTGIRSINIQEVPSITEFTVEYGTTNFSSETNLYNVDNLTLANQFGKIRFNTSQIVNVDGEDYDTYVNIGEGFISVNGSELDDSFNDTVNITINDVDCNADLYYGTGVYTSRNDIVAIGTVCNASTDPACTNIECSDNTLTFTASHFTGFATNANSSLEIWDEVDSGEPFGDQTKYQDDQVKFFANYTNVSGALEGANCSIWFNDTGWTNMSWNSSHSIYEYNRSFSSGATYDWNVSCNYTGYSTINTNDTVAILATSWPCDQGTNDTTCYINSSKTINTSMSFNVIIIENGGSITHAANTDSKTYWINITAVNLTIESGGSISTIGKGYTGSSCQSGEDDVLPGNGDGGGGGITANSATDGGGGAGYGGEGGDGGYYGTDNAGAGGSSYGSLTQPVDLGSGGSGGQAYTQSSYECTDGESGGGFIFLNISDTLNNSGIISSNGNNATNTTTGWYEAAGGGGSGGSVYIIVSTISGDGSITADGGNGGSVDPASQGGEGAGGGAGGGRIAIYYTSDSYTGAYTTYGGQRGIYSETGNGENAAPGTIYLKENGKTNFDLVIDNGANLPSPNTPLGSNNYTIDNLTIYKAKVSITGNINVSNDSVSIRDSTLAITSGYFNVTNNLTLDSSTFSAEKVYVPTKFNLSSSTATLSTAYTHSTDEIPIISSTLTFVNGTTINSDTLSMSGSSTLTSSFINTSVLTVSSGSTITHPALSEYGINITAVNLTIESGGSISTIGKGYTGSSC
ncbi:LamG-like jellyroll fold domain-containing protein, partial [Nanoarchaeota archaeon]